MALKGREGAGGQLFCEDMRRKFEITIFEIRVKF
jgi:hypothetical protein